MTDLTRIHKIQKMLEPHSFAMDPPDRHIQGEECLGFILSHSTITDLEKIDLLTLKKLSTKRVLITGTGGAGQETLANYLTEIGATVDIQTSVGSDKFLIMINHKASVPEVTVSSITEWMKTHAYRTDVISDFQKPPDHLSFQEPSYSVKIGHFSEFCILIELLKLIYLRL